MPNCTIRRRPREVRVCTECRAHKIRCDRQLPCSYCAKRRLVCSYDHPSNPSTATLLNDTRVTPQAPQPRDVWSGRAEATQDDPKPGSTSETVTISQDEWDEVNSKMSSMEEIISSLGSIFQRHSTRKVDDISCESPAGECAHIPLEGVYRSGMPNTDTIHMGPRSAFVDILDRSKKSEDTAQAFQADDLLDELALGNQSAVYPFIDLWSPNPITFNVTAVCSVLPDDEQCQMFLNLYRDIAAVIYPVLGDTSGLEEEVNKLLRGRTQVGGIYRPNPNGLVQPYGVSLGFLSLLFAILASGCQLSDLTVKERELKSLIYVSCAYQCLRMINYVSQPTVEVIQTLLIISNVLSYNMNASASYILLGMTERLCMVLGLHVESSDFSPAERAIRRRVWWAMAFQNSHFSLAYDRPLVAIVSQPEIPFDIKSTPGCRSYFESLCRIISLALSLLRARTLPGQTDIRYHEIQIYRQRVQHILADAAPHLRHREHCVSLKNNIERIELRLHSSHLLSDICRISLDTSSRLDDQNRAIVRDCCIVSLINTVDAFVELHSASVRSSRSWISLQRAIASAFLLVANPDGRCHPRTRDLVEKLEAVLADHVSANSKEGSNIRTESATHIAASLQALREVSAVLRQKSADRLNTGAAVNVIIRSGTAEPTTITDLPASTVGMTAGHASSEDGTNMSNILERVSDVMLFSSMSGQI